MVCEQAFTLRNIGAVLPEPDSTGKGCVLPQLSGQCFVYAATECVVAV
jgi:hypothetical protein